ncbi:MAG: hypothetical protein AAGL98_00080 [Planctomycetota bacterium]
MKKALPWLVGLVGAVGYFAYWETMAFVHPDKYDTLSRVVSTIGANWPPFLVICGLFCGMLISHFFWAWSENPMGKGNG